MFHQNLGDLMKFSMGLQAVARADGTDDMAAFRRVQLACPVLVDAMKANRETAFWAVRWGALAFPRVVIGPKRAASLMATGVSAEAMQDVVAPWSAFLLGLEDSDLCMVDQTGTRTPIHRVAVCHSRLGATGDLTWTMAAVVPDGTMLYRLCVPTKEWLSDKMVWGSELEVDAEEERTLKLLSHLVTGVCIYLSSPETREAARQRSRSAVYRRRRTGPPLAHDFVLGEDVRLDVRAAIREYAERGGRTPKVQSLIRGHWKRQVCGVGRAERKWIHIEPYWRGPEDAPMLLRAHVTA